MAMTDIPSTLNEPMFPTQWKSFGYHPFIDNSSRFEYRRLSEDTYEIRSPETIITVTAEGFNLWGTDKWNAYLKKNRIKSVPRTDV